MGVLELFDLLLDDDITARILNVCTSVNILKLSGFVRDEVAVVFGNRLYMRLQSLQMLVFNYGDTSNLQLMLQCSEGWPMLHSLDLQFDSMRGVGNSLLDLVASLCPMLNSLSLDRSRISDEGMDIIFRGCANLKRLTLKGERYITMKTFQSILDNRLSLQYLLLWSCVLKEAHAARFLDAAKDYQLLPLPKVIVSHAFLF